MGNEGAQWVGMAPFVETPHLIQILGDGTYAHSGQLAVRWAIAAGVNITYKILVNGVVAMTGGQDPQGGADVPTMARILLLQGVKQVIITTDDPSKYDSVALPAGCGRLGPLADRRGPGGAGDRPRHDRADPRPALRGREPAAAQAQHDRRPRSSASLINERVCEGCGDCGQKSNCLSVQPVDTEFGRKTRIDQSSCNLDFSCINGRLPELRDGRAGQARPARRRRERSPSAAAAPPKSIPAPTPTVVVPTTATIS